MITKPMLTDFQTNHSTFSVWDYRSWSMVSIKVQDSLKLEQFSSRLKEEAESAGRKQLFDLAQAQGERPHFTELHNNSQWYRQMQYKSQLLMGKKNCVRIPLTRQRQKPLYLTLIYTASLLLPQQPHYEGSESQQVAGEVRQKEKITTFKRDTDKLWTPHRSLQQLLYMGMFFVSEIAFKFDAFVHLIDNNTIQHKPDGGKRQNLMGNRRQVKESMGKKKQQKPWTKCFEPKKQYSKIRNDGVKERKRKELWLFPF